MSVSTLNIALKVCQHLKNKWNRWQSKQVFCRVLFSLRVKFHLFMSKDNVLCVIARGTPYLLLSMRG